MSRTERRGYDLRTMRWTDSARDCKPRCWCCCGVRKAIRRAERRALKDDLRRDPEHAVKQPFKGVAGW